MKIVTLVASFFLIVAALFSLGARPVRFSEETVTGPAQGNHELDCTVIRPWRSTTGPADYKYPVIGWANGWDQGNVVGEHTTKGYKLGLIEWALDGPYIVAAANQWSVQESDVLACVKWVIDQNDPETAEAGEESEYIDVVDTTKIGLAGHSQGGGAVIKAGDSGPYDFDITAVVAMNPYGPGWVDPENQDGPVLLVGGDDDTTTPPDSYDAVWQAIKAAYIPDNPEDSGPGGVNAVLVDGTHNSEAWGVKYVDGEEETMDWIEAQHVNFGRYQDVTELWWRLHLNDNTRSESRLMRLLSEYPWNQEDCCLTESTPNFELY